MKSYDESVEYFGGEDAYQATKRRDARKKRMCAKNGIRLIEVRPGSEWVHRMKFTVSHFKSTYPQDPSLADVFELARNTTNGTKHFKPKAKTRTQKGFSSGFSNAFARPPIVEFPDGSEKSADRFLCEMVDFWRVQEKNGVF